MSTEVDPQGPHSPLCACALLCFLAGRALPRGSEDEEGVFSPFALAFRTSRHHSTPVLSLGIKRPFAILPPLWEGHGQASSLALGGGGGGGTQSTVVPSKSRPELGHRQTPDNQICCRESGQINWVHRTGEKDLLLSAVYPAAKLIDTSNNYFSFSLFH